MAVPIAVPSATPRSAISQLATTIFAILLLTPLSGCHPQPELTPQQAEGQHLYQVRCAHCHEDNDLALKPAPPDIQGVLKKANLPSGTPATDTEVRRQVLLGKGKMPGFQGRFTEPQMQSLLAYLHTSMPPQQQP